MSLKTNLGASLLQTRQVGDIASSEQLNGFEDVYFNEKSRILLEESMPRTKVNLMNNLTIRKWNFLLANTYFGEVTEADSYDSNGIDVNDVYAGKIITDLSIGYRFSPKFSITIGGNNLLDIYPDERHPSLTDGDQFIYPRRVSQFGANGRYVFARINLSI
jgi:iron complex outermembrane receptor protein